MGWAKRRGQRRHRVSSGICALARRTDHDDLAREDIKSLADVSPFFIMARHDVTSDIITAYSVPA
jgi:hypothetical protein